MVKAVEPDLLKCLPYWAYEQISRGTLLSILSQYRERSGAGGGGSRHDPTCHWVSCVILSDRIASICKKSHRQDIGPTRQHM